MTLKVHQCYFLGTAEIGEHSPASAPCAKLGRFMVKPPWGAATRELSVSGVPGRGLAEQDTIKAASPPHFQVWPMLQGGRMHRGFSVLVSEAAEAWYRQPLRY